MLKKPKILITGACGSVGYELLKLSLENDGISIRVFELPGWKNRSMLNKFRNIEVIYGDLRDPFKVWQVCQGIDFVIHLGALIPPAADKKIELAEAVNVEGTRNIINALKQGNRKAGLLYASSISIYGDRVADPEIVKTDPIVPSEGDHYATTKIKAEKLIKESGLAFSIFRVSAVMGTQTKMNPLFFHMPLSTSLEIITAADAGRAFLQGVLNFKHIENQIYNLSGGDRCRIIYDDFLKKVFQIQGLKKIHFPKNAFANHNFHCGFYADGDELEELIHFRTEDLEDYFDQMKENQTLFSKGFKTLFKTSIRRYLLKQSEPWQAFQIGSGKHFQQFFTIT